MAERAEEWQEAIFELFWYQHNPDDWVAEVVDSLTGERRRIDSTHELAELLQPRARLKQSQPLEPKPGR
jgi:hypothetical protein